ncbi:protein of unknown function [Candidatus Hydrogenisulfobacillus filiaventi]|uniref:Uncharacterized protein n=1 Tax=Candidatus Hydrogenisulfobacillus filiaventi TaxID=2707344 RepID=A0A6F8ZI30_9FIRM|nr:protein of unknown function [Candidatus Hydrogenisulfobacillus filiaventi]
MEGGFEKFMWIGVGIIVVVIVIGILNGVVGPGLQSVANKAISWVGSQIP